MSVKLTEEQLKGIASQLSCPSGASGIKTAEGMALNNNNMTWQSIVALGLKAGDTVMEIGPGNGKHLTSLLAQAERLKYTGIDISELMVDEASKLNAQWVAETKATFLLSDGRCLDFEGNRFDKVFTVNTLYFWADPEVYAGEILRVLKPGGIFCLTFAPKEFMVKLPFTAYVFKLYSQDEAEALLRKAGFKIEEVTKHSEVIRSNAGETVDRDFLVVKASKA